jgi:hypothetical protein
MTDTNIWKTMEVGKIYEALSSMTPEERLKDLYETQKELSNTIKKSMTSTTDELKEQLFNVFDEYLKEEKYEYSDYSYPKEAMQDNAIEIIGAMLQQDEVYEILKKYMRATL